MTIALGGIGVWQPRQSIDPAFAAAIESAGFGALWVGSTPPPDLEAVEGLLAATDHIVIATGIASIWAAPPAVFAASFHRLDARFPGRFLLGLGTQHVESVGEKAARPLDAVSVFLDGLDAEGVPADRRVLAALGPRMLELARDRALGAHPYLVPVAATRAARTTLGEGPLLAIEQRVVVADDPADARTVARASLTRYLELTNYRRSFLRSGFTEAELANGGSDRFVNAVSAFAAPTDRTGGGIAARITEQQAAGADHVALQVVPTSGQSLLEAYRGLATALGLQRR